MSSKKIAMAVFISDTESRLSTRRVGRKESIGIRVCEYKELDRTGMGQQAETHNLMLFMGNRE